MRLGASRHFVVGIMKARTTHFSAQQYETISSLSKSKLGRRHAARANGELPAAYDADSRPPPSSRRCSLNVDTPFLCAISYEVRVSPMATQCGRSPRDPAVGRSRTPVGPSGPSSARRPARAPLRRPRGPLWPFKSVAVNRGRPRSLDRSAFELCANAIVTALSAVFEGP